jgi:hypothetical protein
MSTGGPRGRGGSTLEWRPWGSTAALAAYAVASTDWASADASTAAAGVVTAAVALGLHRRSVAAQVVAQGIVWFWFADTTVEVARQWLGLSNVVEPASAIALHAIAAVASGAALTFATPALRTDKVGAAFAPHAYRPWFLAGAIASAMAAAQSWDLALAALVWGSQWLPVCVALAVSFVAAAVGVARMRAWGVLLGGATAAAATVAALVSGSYAATAVVVAMAALPGVALGLPLVASRLRGDERLRPPSAVRLPVEPAGRDVAAPPGDPVAFGDDEPDEVDARARRARR